MIPFQAALMLSLKEVMHLEVENHGKKKMEKKKVIRWKTKSKYLDTSTLVRPEN